MNRIRFLGIVLLWLGFLSGALAAVQQPDPTEKIPQAQKWKIVNWWWYGSSFLVGAVGVGLIWSTRKPSAKQAASFDQQIDTQRRAIASLVDAVSGLRKEIDKLAPSEIRDAIDAKCSAPLADFAEAREAITHRYGLKSFASVMTDFALAERYVNRAWSAAADGYLEEVASALSVAANRLESLSERFSSMTTEAVSA